ncbi:MAG: hypothetical protein QXO69_00455 [archaeon]
MGKFAAQTLLKALGALCGSIAIQCFFNGKLGIEDVVLLATFGVFLISLGSELNLKEKIKITVHESDEGLVLEGIHREDLLKQIQAA